MENKSCWLCEHIKLLRGAATFNGEYPYCCDIKGIAMRISDAAQSRCSLYKKIKVEGNQKK